MKSTLWAVATIGRMTGMVQPQGDPPENLALSPQYGFASSLEGNLLTEVERSRKLPLAARTARRAWNTT